MKIIVNPEQKTIHLIPTERCNLDAARKDPGPKPFTIHPRELRAYLLGGYSICENED